MMWGMSASDPDWARVQDHFARPDVVARLDAEYRAAVQAGRDRAAEPPPATTIPTPQFLPGCVARYQCPRGCGWWHDESTDPGPPTLLLPRDPQELDAMLSLNAEARGLAYQARVEEAIARHYAAAH